MKKIVLIELNEVPFRVIDDYCRRRPGSALAALRTRSREYETHCNDSMALDPWVSWPTFHRGVNDRDHRILHLGQRLQDVDRIYPPIWRILKDAGLSVGVFGSLHSNCVPEDADDYSFYVPDYFDDTAYSNPRSLLPFQRLNLRMTRESARNVSRAVPIGDALKFVASAPFVGLTARTVKAIGTQLLLERREPGKRIRRRNIQTLLSADLFVQLLKDKKPQFSTFYSNHVAAAMHRYWGATFPGDYDEGHLDAAWVDRYQHELAAAMDAFDTVLAGLKTFVDENPEFTLVLASSMGQAAIDAPLADRFLTIVDMKQFIAALGVDPGGTFEERPAMVPCRCVTVPPAGRDAFVKALKSLAIDGQRIIESTSPVGPMSYDERENGFFQVFIQADSYAGPQEITVNGTVVSFERAGLGFMVHEDGVNCTAQHTPEGSLVTYRAEDSKANGGLATRPISTLDFVPSVLANFGLQLRPYMRGTPSISFN